MQMPTKMSKIATYSFYAITLVAFTGAIIYALIKSYDGILEPERKVGGWIKTKFLKYDRYLPPPQATKVEEYQKL